MQKLIKEKFSDFELLNPFHIKGGDGNTSYTISNGNTGSDCYSDDDNSGGLSNGDGVLLDDGRWITYQENQ